METQPYNLPWADPDFPGMGEAPEHLQFLFEIIMWGNRADVLEKGNNLNPFKSWFYTVRNVQGHEHWILMQAGQGQGDRCLGTGWESVIGW